MKKVYPDARRRSPPAQGRHADYGRGFGLCGIPESLIKAIRESV